MTPEEHAEQLITSAAGVEAVRHLDTFKLERLIADVVRAAVAQEREACARAVDALAERVGEWADRDGPDSVAASKYTTYRNASAAIRARSTS